jgi:hypothetical protein
MVLMGHLIWKFRRSQKKIQKRLKKVLAERKG